MRCRLVPWSVVGSSLLVLTTAVSAADLTPEGALKFVPRQRDVEIETPKPAEFAKCVVKAEQLGKTVGWVVSAPNGQVLRRFLDTNNDDQVDQWRYYNNGLEVYREIDSNFNQKPDHYRWLNTGGSRWGVDTNEDKKIDEWKILSAEEASRVAVNAMLENDADALRMVLVNQQDLERLKVAAKFKKNILANVSNPAVKLRDLLSKSRSLTPTARWMRFDVASAMPSIIPADDGKAAVDLMLYENAMAIVEIEGTPPKNSLLVQIGEIVKVGDVWKLTQIPLPIEGNQVQIAAGVLMQPRHAETTDPAATSTPSNSADPRVQELVQRLQKLDATAPTAEAAPVAFVKFSTDRATILKQLVSATAKNPTEQETWFKQLVDGLTSAVQAGGQNFDDGLREIKLLETQVRQQAKNNSTLLPYVAYRRMLAEYSIAVQSAKTSAEQSDVQKDWIKELQAFVEAYPKAEDAPDVMLQLATSLEFGGKVADSRKWFDQLAQSFPKTQAGKKAAGAMLRLDMKGKPLPLSFKSLDGGQIDIRSARGKTVLIVYWATWCKPCFEDLPKLRAMYQQYRNQGFDVIGVNLDHQSNGVKPYLQQNGMTWPQIYEPGGLDSPPSLAFGIISLPTMFLVDKAGIVHSRPASMDDVKAALPDLLGLKKTANAKE